ncbi:hypothetical protein [Pseudomonas sp. EZ-C24]|uniref:hypothetical protein n=1 Tax=Pseudomonas sp. EZ-C24 TaxID=2753617 RepID=UPI00165DFF1D|nr:hypothetical protein [Pseudomonas sp. EZ-C24]
MRARFVVVSALPIKEYHYRRAVGFCTAPSCNGFDLYDTVAKLRLPPTYAKRADAQAECARRNETACA